MSRLKSLMVSLEDNEENKVEEQEPITGEVVAEGAEVAQAAAEGSMVNDAADEATEDLGDLEKIQDVVEDTVADNGPGMDPTTAKMADIAVEAIRERLGLRSQAGRVSMESYGDKNRRAAATRIALEGIGDSIKKGFGKVMEVIKALIKRVVEFFKKIFSFNRNMLKVIEKLRANAEKIQSENLEFEKEPIEGLKLPAAFENANAFANLDVHMALTKAVGKLNSTMKTLPMSLDSSLMSGTILNKSEEKVKEILDRSISVYFKPLTEVFTQTSGGKSVSKPLYDGTVITATADETGWLFPKIDFSSAGEEKIADSLKVLPVGTQLNWLTKLKNLIEETNNISESDKDVQKFGEGMAKGGERFMKASGTEDDKMSGELIKFYRSSVQMFASLNLQLVAKNVAFTKGMCQYIQESQKHFKKAEA